MQSLWFIYIGYKGKEKNWGKDMGQKCDTIGNNL
jgi:hypothetical protein